MGGDIGERLNRSMARLQRPPFNLQFILADVSFSEKRIFTEYSGDISGRILGVAATERICGRPESWPVADLLRELKKYQRADGHFGAEQDLAKGIVGDRDMPILWGNGRLLVGLVEAYRAGNDAEALEMARRLGDYYIRTDPLLDRPDLVERFGNYAAGFATCYFSGIEGLVGLSRATKDRRYLRQAERMAVLMERTTNAREQHSHGRLCALRGLLELFEATGKEPYLQHVIEEQAVTQSRYLWPTGGISEMTIPTFHRSEGCTEADWLRLNMELWRLTGNDAYLDAAELTLKNELAVNQFPNGGFGHRVARIVNGRMDGYFGIDKKETQEAYWCCSEHGPRALLTLASYAIVPRGGELFVNLYDPVQTVVTASGVSIKVGIQTSDSEREATLTLQPERPVKLKLLLREPAWCRGLSIDGEKMTRTGTRAVLERTWKRGDRLLIHLPREVHVRVDQSLQNPSLASAPAGSTGAGLLFEGPHLLGYPETLDRPKVSLGSLAAGRGLLQPIRSFAPDAGFRCRVSLIP